LRAYARRLSSTLRYALLATALLFEAWLLWPLPFGETDHIVLWQVGHTVLAGGSPYDPAVWRSAAALYDAPQLRDLASNGGIGVWPYPPWTGYLFVPFGALPLEIGAWALHVSYVAVGLIAASVLARLLPWRDGRARTVALVLFAIFQPFVIAVRWGQFSSYLLAGIALVSLGIAANRITPFVAGAMLLATKPHVTAVLGALIVFQLVQTRRWRMLAIAAAALCSVGAITWLRYPEWSGVAVTGAIDRLTVIARFASPVSVVMAVAGPLWLPVAALVIASCLAACALALRLAPRSVRGHMTLAAGAVAGLLLTPYSFVYDHLILAPAGLIAIWAVDRARGRVDPRMHLGLIAGVAFAFGVAPWAAFLATQAQGTDALSGAIPIVFAVLLVGAAAVLRRAEPPDEVPATDGRHVSSPLAVAPPVSRGARRADR